MAEKSTHRILLVDDEVSITKALFRLLKNEGYQIDTCNSGHDGIALLESGGEPISLIISDQRMPGMNGTDFLEKASVLAPDAIRFLLTGYSELQTVVDAVNKGKIHRYMTKPWNDEAMLLHVRQAIQDVELRRENARLHLITKRQNKQLYELGLSLEKKVKERSRALKEKNTQLELLNRKLEESFAGTVRLLMSLIENTNRTMGKCLRQTGRFSKRIALKMGLSVQEAETIGTAGQLHDIGLVGLSEVFLQKSEDELTDAELQQYQQHPVLASIILEAVEKFSEVSQIVLYHHERYDGAGFPSGLRGEEIPLGSRIVAVASDYCRIVNCWPKNRHVARRKLNDLYGISLDAAANTSVDQFLRMSAEKIILNGIHKKYDSRAVAVLIGIFRKDETAPTDIRKNTVLISDLHPGMTISQDLFMMDGRLLLAQGTVLEAPMIQSIQKIGEMKLIRDTIVVKMPEE